MGGFFLVLTRPGRDPSSTLDILKRAFSELGFAAPRIIVTAEYVFAAYPTIEGGSLELHACPNGDFVGVAGTCLGEEETGAAAAARYYGGAMPAAAAEGVVGHYAIVRRCGGRTEIRLDPFGGYHLYYNLERAIVSNSFYALAMALDRLSPLRQSALEYVFNGVVSGDETLFREIALAPIGATIRIDNSSLDIVRPPLEAPRTFTEATRGEALDRSLALLDRYFAAVARSFGDRVGCALSGGYDSRLMLACMRRHGIRPRVFVYGRDGERDVGLAAEIARREGFALAVIDKNRQPLVPPAEFAAIARRNFLAQDGYGWGGIFQNDAEISESARRVRGNAIAFNGGGGEIFRNFFYLPNREYPIRDLLWSFYSRFDPRVCTENFDAESYYGGLERKVRKLVGGDRHRLQRPTVEWLYHTFRCRSWDGKVDSICGRYGSTAMPYLEPAITRHASTLPLAWKNHGAYEAELICRADRRLAGYRSVYGHDFGGPPPLSRRLGDYATYVRPPWLRRYTYRLRHWRPRHGDWPGYLGQAYRNAALPAGPVMVHKLFRLGRIADPEQFARILSLEYALQYFGGRVAADFQ
jgi:hypothetical protein